jgi:hypothetical protein
MLARLRSFLNIRILCSLSMMEQRRRMGDRDLCSGANISAK